MDSFGNFPPHGLLEGTFADYGEYEECLEAQTPVNKRPIIRGQYCLAKIILPFPNKNDSVGTELDSQDLSSVIIPTEDFDSRKVTVNNMIGALNIVNGTIFRLALCLPSVCSAQEVQHLLNKRELIHCHLSTSLIVYFQSHIPYSNFQLK